METGEPSSVEDANCASKIKAGVGYFKDWVAYGKEKVPVVMQKVRVFKEKALKSYEATSECVHKVKEIWQQPAENDTEAAIENNAEDATENNAEASTTRAETTAEECIEEEAKK